MAPQFLRGHFLFLFFIESFKEYLIKLLEQYSSSKLQYRIVSVEPAGGLHLFLDIKTKHEEGISELKAALNLCVSFSSALNSHE